MTDARDERGRFVAGNAGGPGRPRRAIEREYLAVISEAVTLDDWRAIVAHAVDVAKQGDDKARAWLAKYVIGDNPITLTELLARELLDVTPDVETLVKVDEISESTASKAAAWAWGERSFIERAREIQKRMAESEKAEERRAQREARKAAQTALPDDKPTV